MATFIVELARLVRETKRVEVEAEDADKIDLASVYEQDDGNRMTGPASSPTTSGVARKERIS